jgi:2-polyprenyl-3-methyl-5-hydroxy-6-metoxy-1,4-benzoquinol methylase
MKNGVCCICGVEGRGSIVETREMMFGLGDIFYYLECPSCHTLSLLNTPIDMKEYYTNDYYSFEEQEQRASLGKLLRIQLARKRAQSLVESNSLFWRLSRRLSRTAHHHLWLKEIYKVSFDLKLLDVGCGQGRLLQFMVKEGFRNLTGVDPYIEDSIESNCIKIVKGDLYDVEDDCFDVVLFNHSLEHIDHPKEALKRVKSILCRNGYCIISTPVADSFAFAKYRNHWIQIDAPRHLQVFSRKGLEILASINGFKIERIIFNSNEFQFWGSEQYSVGIPLYSVNSFMVNPSGSIFSKKDVRTYRKEASALNRKNLGDQAIFILRSC